MPSLNEGLESLSAIAQQNGMYSLPVVSLGFFRDRFGDIQPITCTNGSVFILCGCTNGTILVAASAPSGEDIANAWATPLNIPIGDLAQAILNARGPSA